MTPRVHVRAPCRLHFGMFSFGHAGRPQFGGVGAMVEPPNVEVSVRPDASFSVRGALADRVETFIDRLVPAWNLSARPCCAVEVVSPPDHTGLGVGTQLALSIAAGLRRFLVLPEISAAELALALGRGARSAVGTYGFERGGLVVDGGKKSASVIGHLVHRVDLPDAWRFVLVRPGHGQGLAGAIEAAAFARLPPVPAAVTDALWQITERQLLPAATNVDCDAFGEAVYQFNRLAGECFAAVQGGAFASSATAKLIAAIRGLGVAGAGQTSWGPTVFAVTRDDAEAHALRYQLLCGKAASGCEITIARPNNAGARFAAE
jgi:beta-RFAP synthase